MDRFNTHTQGGRSFGVIRAARSFQWDFPRKCIDKNSTPRKEEENKKQINQKGDRNKQIPE
jgi:hypothetical protein